MSGSYFFAICIRSHQRSKKYQTSDVQQIEAEELEENIVTQ